MISAGTMVRITRGTYANWVGEVEGKEDNGFLDPEGEYYSIALKRSVDDDTLKKMGIGRTFNWIVREDGLEIVEGSEPNVAFKMKRMKRR